VLYLCPGCGAFVSESASKCPKCGEVLESGSDIDEAPDASEITEQQDRVENEIELLEQEITEVDDSEPVTLFLCSECGAFTGGNAKNCPNCGALMGDEEPATPIIESEDTEINILEMLVQTVKPPHGEVEIIEDLKHLESAEDVAAFLETIVDDDVDDMVLAPPAELLPERSDGSDDLLSKLILEAETFDTDKPGKRSKAMQTVGDMLVGESAKSFVGDNDSITLCKTCGAFVSESAGVCNVCGNSLQGDKRISVQSGQELSEPGSGEEEADSVIRKMLGVADDTVLDTEVGKRFQSDGSLGLCTLCGAFISQDAEICPVCGTHIEDMPEFIPSMDIVGPESEDHGLAICPHCGVFVQEGARECMSCVKPIPEGATVPISQEAEKPEDPDRAVNILKTFLGVEKALEMAPVRDSSFRGLDLCPDCGAFVSMDAVVCSICGNSLFEDSGDSPKIRLDMPDVMKCPNCSASMDVHSEECPLCGMSFAVRHPRPEPEGPGEDITDFLDSELGSTIRTLESVDAPAIEPQDIAEAVPDDDTLEDLFILEDVEELEISLEPDAEFPEAEIPIEALPIEVEDPIPPTEPETLEFIEPEESEIYEPEELPAIEAEEETFMEETVVTSESVAEIPDIESEVKPSVNAANWTTGVYVSVAAICFFLFFYIIAPGDYAPGLAVIFGTLMLLGTYLAMTEKAIFFRGDLKQASVFIAGIFFAAVVILHWPMGLMTAETGFLNQPSLDRVLLSLSVLLTTVGLLWIRARVRFVFTWFFGNLLLFMATVISFTYSNYGTGIESPVLIVAGFGSGLVFLSLIFLQYERAINSSIETDIVRGDAHYLKRDYVGALASYDSALATAQMKKVGAYGSPIVAYDVPWYSKGSALILMGEFEEGIKCLDMALAINPRNEVTWVNKGNAHSKLGQHGPASDCYRKAIECNPFYEIAWNNLGNVSARKKDYLDALKHYNRAIKINPAYDDAWINKGYVLAKMGKRDQAVKCLNRVGSRVKSEPAPVDRDAHLL